jgi:hypothetical protein
MFVELFFKCSDILVWGCSSMTKEVLPLSMVDNSVFSPNRLTTPIDPAYSSLIIR